MPGHRNLSNTFIVSICCLTSFILFLSAFIVSQQIDFNIPTRSLGSNSTAANRLTHQNQSANTKRSKRRAYQYGDVLKKLYGPDVEIMQHARLDPTQICLSDIVNPLTVEGWHLSGAGTFIRQWMKAYKDTPGLEVKARQRGYDFRTRFLYDVVPDLHPPECHLNSTCNRLACRDIVENLVVQDPAIAMAVIYTDKHIADFLNVNRGQLELFDHVASQLDGFAEEVIRHFAWRWEKSTDEFCRQIADAWHAGLQKIVMAIGVFAGPAGSLAVTEAGSITNVTSSSSRLMGTSLIRFVGLLHGLSDVPGKDANILTSLMNAAGRTAKAQNWDLINPRLRAYTGDGVWSMSPVVINNLSAADAWRGTGVGSLAGSICAKVPQSIAGTEFNINATALLDETRKRLLEYRKNTEHEVLRLKMEDSTAIGDRTMVDYLEDGSFFLNKAAEDYFLQGQEETKKNLTEYLKSVFVMQTLQSSASGVHCTFVEKVCDRASTYADSSYCVEPHVKCQAYSWIGWKNHQYKIHHFGQHYLNYREGWKDYGFDTEYLVRKSWQYYKAKLFEPGLEGDLLNDAQHLVGAKFNKEAPMHLPVCFDTEGVWSLGELAADPFDRGVFNSMVLSESYRSDAPCSCGHLGRETEAFWRTTNLFTLYTLPHLAKSCLGGSRADTRHPYRVMGESTPWRAYQTHCDLFPLMEKFAQESGTPHIDVYGHQQRDPYCEVNEARYKELTYKDGLDFLQSQCVMCDDRNFKEAIKSFQHATLLNLPKGCDNLQARVCNKIDYNSRLRAPDLSITSIALPTNVEIPMDKMTPPFNLADIPTSRFLCPLPKPWLDESIPPACIELTANYYRYQRLPRVNQYGFLNGTTRSTFTATLPGWETASNPAPPPQAMNEQDRFWAGYNKDLADLDQKILDFSRQIALHNLHNDQRQTT